MAQAVELKGEIMLSNLKHLHLDGWGEAASACDIIVSKTFKGF